MKRTPEEEIIFQALSRIETPPAPLEEGIWARRSGRKTFRRPYLRMALACACLLAVLGAAATAAGLTNGWRYFYPAPLPTESITDLGLTQTHGDYTITLEEAVADDSRVLVLLSLTRTDGEDIDPELRIKVGDSDLSPTITPSGPESYPHGTNTASALSSDRKTLYLTISASDLGSYEESLTGKTLTLNIPMIGKWFTRNRTTISLAPLAELDIPTYNIAFPSRTERQTRGELVLAQNCKLDIPPVAGFSGAAVRGALMITGDTDGSLGGLTIAVDPIRETRGNQHCITVEPTALIDTRTGARYERNRAEQLQTSDGTYSGIFLHAFRDAPFTPEDLPWLEMEVAYEISELVCTEPFTFTFQVDHDLALDIPLTPVEIDGATYQLKTLHLSPLNITLDLVRNDRAYDAATRLPLSITLRDGTVLTPQNGGGRLHEDCNLFYNLWDEAKQPIFLDTSQVASVTIGGHVFPVP